MSALPKRTRVLVKDLLFQEKYRLTDTQVDIMAYIFNALTWAFKIDGYLILTSQKIISDMPKITQKTLESSLRALKSMELIETEIISVPQWNGANVRGVKITKKGMKYNSSLYAPTAAQIFEELEDNLEAKEKKIKELEEKIKNLEIKIEDNQNSELKIEDNQNSEPTTQEEDKQEEETKRPKIENFKEFVEAVKKEFQDTSEPICNMVKGWAKETTFYINSYNKLAITTLNGDYQQLRNPQDISKFWKWLYLNQDRIGDVVDFSKKLDAEELTKRFKGKKVNIDDKIFRVIKIEEAEDKKVKITFKDENGKIATISDKQKNPITLKAKDCEELLFHWLC